MEKIKKILKKLKVYELLKRIYLFWRNLFIPLGAIRNYILFPIKAFLRVRKISPFYRGYEEIEAYKDKYKGKRCFIIATGPSLRMEDVEKLSNEYTFAVNSFYKILDKTSFRPTFYITLDPDSQKSFEANGEFLPGKYATEKAFLNDVVRRQKKYDNVIYLPVCYQNHWYSIGKENFPYDKNLKWTNDLLWGIYDKYTVTISAIDIAVYMGFGEIYLLGVDCNYTGTTTYFINPGEDYEKKTANMALATQIAMTKGYEFVANNMKKHGVMVYNATRGGMLEVFERRDFDELMVARREESGGTIYENYAE